MTNRDLDREHAREEQAVMVVVCFAGALILGLVAALIQYLQH